MAKAAFIGLGVMGYPMAGHLQKAGHAVTVFNRTAAKAERWVAQFGGAAAPTPAAAADGADFRRPERGGERPARHHGRRR
jgi:3-hydroxyisobutyrate dehydrogenase